MVFNSNYIPKVSVVLPSYNAERTIVSTIKSVLSQSCENFELIIVNDGSTDNTQNVISSFSSDSRIKIIHQNNSGANAARKLGVEHASGTYITFIDADDLFKTNALASMLDQVGDADILVTRARYSNTLSKEEYLRDTLDHLLPKELWGKLFKSGLLNNWVMDLQREIIIGEDFIWNIRAALYVQRVIIIKDNYYDYEEINDCSLMKSFNKTVEYEEQFYNVLVKSLKEMGFSNVQVVDMLAVQRFYSFVEIVRSRIKVNKKDRFILEKFSNISKILKGKINFILYIIMSVGSMRAKMYLLRIYLLIIEKR